MEIFIIILKVVVAVSLLNVWLIQYNKPTQWRGGNAQNIVEEFKVYGLPVWMCYVVGFLKVTSSIALIASIWFPVLEFPAAATLAVLLAGSISMHLKISDLLKKSFPAALFLSMCLLIIFL
ncbi:DoxX family protein [Rasiella sp. SM2506]|uniref:DoxX family protein n=1 Tax=Rasiella sp. SM2506 TaxID=3423914 RepID=UPI003D7B2932